MTQRPKPRTISLTSLLLAAALALPGCGGAPAAGGANPAPVLTGLQPASVISGWPQFDLGVSGTGMNSAAVVNWNGLPQLTFWDSSDLSAHIVVTPAMVAQPGSAALTVTQNGRISNTLTFTITPAAPGTVGVTQLITIAPDGSAANGNTLDPPAISGTGRYVAFDSEATNLVANPPNTCVIPLIGGPCAQAYIRDTCVGAPAGCTPTTTLVSVAMDGSVGNNNSLVPVVSDDGRYVAFQSIATNLAPNDTNPAADPDIFLRDTCIGAPSGCVPSTTRIDVRTDGAQSDGGASPAISADGRFVVFASIDPDLVPGGGPDANTTKPFPSIYTRDTCNGATAPCVPETSLVSVSSTGQPDLSGAELPKVSPDGRFVTFGSGDFLGNDSEGGVYVRDTCNNAPSGCVPSTTNAYVAYNGAEPNGPLAAFNIFAASADGRFVTFAASLQATNLVPSDANNSADVFLRDTCIGAPATCSPTTTLISVVSDGTQGNAGSFETAIDGSGRYVVFSSEATNLVPGGTNTENVYLRDTCNGAPPGCSPSTTLLSLALDGLQADGESYHPVISADGHWVAFDSLALNLLWPAAPPPGLGSQQVFLAKTGH